MQEMCVIKLANNINRAKNMAIQKLKQLINT